MTIERVKTGIDGLDDLLEGGLPRYSATIVSGTPGTCKTLIGLQYIVNGAIKYGEPGIFFSSEDSADLIKGWFEQMGWDLEDLEKRKLIKIYNPTIKEDEGEDYYEHINNDNFIDIITSMGAKRIAFDSITVILEFSEGFGGKRNGIRSLQKRYKELGLTALFTHERKVVDEKLEYDMSFFVIDGTILLDIKKIKDSFCKILRIDKMRGTDHSRQEHELVVGKKGIKIKDI